MITYGVQGSGKGIYGTGVRIDFVIDVGVFCFDVNKKGVCSSVSCCIGCGLRVSIRADACLSVLSSGLMFKRGERLLCIG